MNILYNIFMKFIHLYNYDYFSAVISGRNPRRIVSMSPSSILMLSEDIKISSARPV